MESAKVYLLTTLTIDNEGNAETRNLALTLSLHQAERHRSKGVENDFETFELPATWREQNAETDLVLAMRGLCSMVKELQDKVRIEEFG